MLIICRFIVVLTICGAIVGCATFGDHEGQFVKAFGAGSDTTISSSNGGRIDDFNGAVKEVLRMNRMVRIDGPCASACAVFADKARPNVCITDNAEFLFHRGTEMIAFPYSGRTRSVSSIRVRMTPSMSADIAAWIESRGGFPSEGYLSMDAKQAASFWPLCE